MGIHRKMRKLYKKYGDAVQVRLEDGCIHLSGQLDTWDDVYAAGAMMAEKNGKIHVVNDIRLKGAKPIPMRKPSLRDEALEGEQPDVLVVGAGISGCAIARELAKWKLQVLLVDKEADFALQASGRNDGEVHVGMDLPKGSLKHEYVLKGNHLYDQICEELDVPFRRIGQYACFTQGWLRPFLAVMVWWRKNFEGIRDAQIVGRKELLKRNPTMNPDFRFAIYNSSAGIVSPYELTIAYAENAADNGVKISLNTVVESFDLQDGKITAAHTNRGTVHPKVVVNAAGVFSDDVAGMADDRFYSIHPRRGTDAIQDVKSGKILSTIASIVEVNRQTMRSHTKGGGLLDTIHGNILAGPDAVECREKEDYATYPESIENIYAKQKKTVALASQRDIITYFTGVRAPTYEEDFVIEWGRKCPNMYHVGGIQSPGLTSAPAFAKDVSRQIAKRLRAPENPDFDPKRRGIPRLKDMPLEQRAEMIRKNPDYGVIVCRCEEVSRGEILDALNSPCCPQTVDAVKKRVRPGMGRCQGGFCSPLVMQIIAEKNHIPLEDVRKSGAESVVLYGKTKEGEGR